MKTALIPVLTLTAAVSPQSPSRLLYGDHTFWINEIPMLGLWHYRAGTGAIHLSFDSADESWEWFLSSLSYMAPGLWTPALCVEKMRTATVLLLCFSLRLCVRMWLSRKDAKTPGREKHLGLSPSGCYQFFVTDFVVNGFLLRSEGDARGHVSRAVPRGLQPLQGWFSFDGQFRWRRGACHRLFSASP